MKFYYNKIILWLKDGRRRDVEFQNNKVNIITGDSNTGKTAILDIIDYCFFSSEYKIPESKINENVAWYGLQITINSKKVTIARKSPTDGKVSDEYYYSSIGEVPAALVTNISENGIKEIIETEYSINHKTVISFGSNSMRAGSKISIRYFQMFNTISGNIIENDSGVYFDKQEKQRYRDALPRIFDLAIGIENVENILKKEKKNELELKLNSLLKKKEIIDNQGDVFRKELDAIISRAKEYSIIDSSLTAEDSISELSKEIFNISNIPKTPSDRSRIEKEYYLIERKIKNLRKFLTEYSEYLEGQKVIEDSLLPIQYLVDNEREIIKTSIYDELISYYASELKTMKNANRDKKPVDRQVTDYIYELEIQKTKLSEKLNVAEKDFIALKDDAEKYYFLGQIKTKIELFLKKDDNIYKSEYDSEIKGIEEALALIIVEDSKDKKDLFIGLAEEIIKNYMEFVGVALENYASYMPFFDYTNKKILLRKPMSTFLENTGSSSNFMFLHLFFTLAVHQIAFLNKSPFIAPYIIIDQISRPYYGSKETKKEFLIHSDESKIKQALNLLNNYIEKRVEADGEFQIILFEHIPVELFAEYSNIILVEEFRNGNALIPN
jgi:hypothetical protein